MGRPVRKGSQSTPDAAMSVVGQKLTSRPQKTTSALPPKADIKRTGRHVRLVPNPEVPIARDSQQLRLVQRERLLAIFISSATKDGHLRTEMGKIKCG